MENNIREIKEKCNVFSKCVDVDLDFQENLMSYNDDLLKIIRCCVNNYIVNTDYANSTLTVYGKSKIYLTYVSESTSCITTADFEEDFQKTVAIEGGYEDVTADVSVVNRYSNFRVINQRRIDIHNAFALDIKLCAPSPINMIEEAEGVLIKRDTVNYLSLVGTSYSKAEFEDEAAIPSDSDVIRKIINTFATVRCEDVKIIKDKMLVRAAADFSLLYTTDTEKEVIRKCEKSVTISKIVDIGGIDEGDDAIVKLTLGNVYAKPKADKNNELRGIELIGDIHLNSSVYRKISARFSTDSYATENEIKNEFSKISLNTNGAVISDIINDKTVFEFDNVNIVEILDLSLNMNDGKNLELAAYVRNENAELIFITQKKEISVKEFNTAALYVKSFDYIVKSANEISVRYLIEYTAAEFEEKTYSILSDIQFSDTTVSESPALVVYFARENELIWDIAKKFRTSADLIKAENELKDDVLDSRRILLIPGM